MSQPTNEQQERNSLDRINTAAELRKHAQRIHEEASALATYAAHVESGDVLTNNVAAFALGRANKLFKIYRQLDNSALDLDQGDEHDRLAAQKREMFQRIMRIDETGEGEL